MPQYRLECVGECREIYFVVADDEGAAREAFERGQIDLPTITECSTEIQSITEGWPT